MRKAGHALAVLARVTIKLVSIMKRVTCVMGAGMSKSTASAYRAPRWLSKKRSLKV